MRRRLSIALALAAFLLPAAAAAQQQPAAPGAATPGAATPGAVPGQQPLFAPAPTAPGGIIDYREQMRVFIQHIATYARGLRRDFSVVPMGGLDLLVKADPVEPETKLPARTYAMSISGVMQDGLFFGVPEFGKPTPEDRRKMLLPLVERAKKSGLKVLDMEYATEPRTISDAYRQAAKMGLTFFAAPAVGLGLNALPRYPRHPYDENGDSILSLRDVKNFAVLRDSSSYGRQDEFALTMHGTNYDLLVVDVFHAVGEPLSKSAVETLKYKKLGAKRLVFAYVDIGSAASYSYYWKPNWREGSPKWISAPTPTDPDRYFVEYWQPEWQQIIFGNAESYIYGIVTQGFDGVILDGVRNYLYFEGGLEALAAAEQGKTP